MGLSAGEKFRMRDRIGPIIVLLVARSIRRKRSGPRSEPAFGNRPDFHFFPNEEIPVGSFTSEEIYSVNLRSPVLAKISGSEVRIYRLMIPEGYAST